MSGVSHEVASTPPPGVNGVSHGISLSGTHEPDSPPPPVSLPPGTPESYTISEAAELLGVHPNTLRKRIRKGTLPAMLLYGPTGREYRIDAAAVLAQVAQTPLSQRHSRQPDSTRSAVSVSVPISQPDSPIETDRLKESVTSQTPPSLPPSAPAPTEPPGGTALQTLARAREMAAYTEQILAPYMAKIEQQAEEIGRLKAQLEHAQERTQRAEAHAADVEPARPSDAATNPREWDWERDRVGGSDDQATAAAEESAARQRRPWWKFW